MINVLILTSNITGIFQAEALEMQKIVNDFSTCKFKFIKKRMETQDDILWADVITGHPKPSLLKQAKQLKWLHLQSAGVNDYEDLQIYGNPQIIVTRSADVFSAAMAEHTIGMILALNRLFPHFIRNEAEHKWERVHASFELSNSTVVMLGTGSIAGEIVKRLKGFDCQIIGVRRDINKLAAGYDKIYPVWQLPEALKQADYIINSLPLTAATYHLLGEKEFALMKERAIVINVGRGKTIDTRALIKALQDRKIAGAGLDVCDPEPLDGDSPLWDMENVIITPHSSGDSLNTEKRRIMLFKKQLIKFMNGEKLDHLIDFKAGY